MQRILLTGALCLMMSGASAQPWMRQFEGKDRIKLQDVVEARQAERAHAAEEQDDDDLPKGIVKEGKDYHFDRWRWYWEQHLDEDGYIVPKSRTYQEWEAYKKRLAKGGMQQKTTATSANWTFQGPDKSPANGRGLGRIQKITFHPTDTNIFWVGTAGGGAWKTTNGGTSWTCMTDALPVLGAADVTYNPLNTNVIYLCTGDRDATDNSSIGLLKSTDGGATWNTTGFQFTRPAAERTNALLVNPLDTAALLLTTSTGIYQSRDGGATWAQRSPGAYRDLVYRPGDTAVVYATSSQMGSSQIYRSADGGRTWTQVTHVAGGPSRVSIAVSPAAPNMVKAIFANSSYGLEGIYHSSDTGKTFTKIFTPANCSQNYLANNPTPTSSNCDGQGWYDLAIAVSPLDSNQVVIGGINSWYSTNGGFSWQLANQWWNYVLNIKTVHADKHYMAFHPLKPTVFFEGNDGGIFKTSNINSILGNTWVDLTNGMGITQFYRMSVANHTTSVLGGAQDNGTKRITPGAPTMEHNGGDGMNCELDPTNPVTYYSSIQYGDIYRDQVIKISDNIPGQPVGAWITPYTLHPRDGSRIIAGYDRLYYSTTQGDNWTAVSPVFSSQKISRVAFAMSNLNTFYALSGNLVRRSNDLGATWTNMLGAPGGIISDIIVDHRDKQRFWVTYSGYGSNKVAMYDSLGGGWTTLNDSLPNVPVNCITIDTSNGTIYIGTDVAVFYRDRTMNHWALWNTGLPAAEVTDMGINYSTGDIWASTYGRGLWRSPKADGVPYPTGISVVPFATDVITVSPNPASGPFEIRTSEEGLAGQRSTVTILDISGRSVWSGQRSFSKDGLLRVDVTGLPRATYIVDVTAANGLKARAKLMVY
jgi:photosystem II stability/assembly factor-like uncharacterized protein